MIPRKTSKQCSQKKLDRQSTGERTSLGAHMKDTLALWKSTLSFNKYCTHSDSIYFVSFSSIWLTQPQSDLIILSNMKENAIKLNQIVTQKQLREKKRGSLHALNNSFKRNVLVSCDSAPKYESGYECKLPQVNFSRRDLSIIFRYLLYKQELHISDRNLLRRILLSIFQEELIQVGTRKFVNHLKLLEGDTHCEVVLEEQRQFYFVLKGKGVVTTGPFSYYVKQGDTFGQIELLSDEKISKIQFQSKFLVLKLQQKYFNEFYRDYFQKKYKEKQGQLACIKENFLDKVPLLNKYIFCNKLQYKTFSPGQKIVSQGQPLAKLYFLSSNINSDSYSGKCIGLFQLIRQRCVFKQSIYCNKKGIIPYVDVEAFKQYVMNNCNQIILMNESSAFDKYKLNTKSSFQAPEVIRNFMNIKVVKLKLNRNRLKTQTNEFYETSFKFFKQILNRSSINPQKLPKDSRPLTRTRYERTHHIPWSKSLKNNYL